MQEFIVLILCKQTSVYSKALLKLFKKNNIPCKMIVDFAPKNLEEDIIVYEDEALRKDGFFDMQNAHFKKKIKDPGAWEKSIYFLRQNLNYKYYYFIEDDVFCKNIELFLEFFKKVNEYSTDLIASHIATKEESPGWDHWGEIFPDIKAVLCVSRMSKHLIEKVLEFREKNGSFVFLERMFIGVCVEEEMSYLDFLQDPNLKDFFYRYGQLLEKSPEERKKRLNSGKFTHPVKPYY